MSHIDRIALNVANLDAGIAFYRGLGFVPGDAGPHHGGRHALMTLGDTRLELVEPYEPGVAYPQPRAANNPWFQHFAIAVSDMATAYERLSQLDFAPISTSGPELLPPSTGGVTAYKFRDSDGHPLELSFNPARSRRAGEGVFLGIDHTAVAVRDIDTSVNWYRDTFGARMTTRLLNQGPEQDRLDGLTGVQLNILVVEFDSGPHVELLHYAAPISRHAPIDRAASDIAATCTVLRAVAANEVADPDGHRFMTIAG